MLKHFRPALLSALLVVVATAAALAQSCPCSIWSSATTPGTVDGGDPNGGEFGVKFRSDSNGFITGVRFYKSSANTGTHSGHLWSSTGTLLASATFTNESASGWQQVSFSNPVAITANTTYVASYFTSTGHYSFDSGFFSSSGVDNVPLHALANGVDGPNGVFAQSGSPSFPASTFNASNYWVDVVFVTTLPPPVPAVATFTPSNGATGVSTITAVTATFSEAMDPTTITSSTFQLLDPSNNVLSANVTYNSTTFTATLETSAPLLYNTAYTAVVVGGATGVKDTSGAIMPSNFTWSFTSAGPTGTCPCTIWPSTTTPGTVDGGDPSAGEFGVRFRADVSGFITGIRFYKSTTNTGTHTGHLWSNTGTLLASATFSNESASGWQQVNFNTAVPVTAGTTYVASYFTSAGHYSFDSNFFVNSVDNSPLHALSDGFDGPNGIFNIGAASAFPASTFHSSNYWVDVVFNTTAPPQPPVVTSFLPPNGAVGVSALTAVTATFNESLDPTTVNTSTFQLLDPSNNVVSASVTYNNTNFTATLQPTAPLAPATTYTAIVRGGTSGVKDPTGDIMASNVSWSFTTSNGAGSCPCTIWAPVTTPGTVDGGDASKGEFGVKFRSDTTGFITGIRFYKASTNTGTHTGHLWSNTGTLLASATFSNESVSGWQQVNFSSPVAVTAGTTYVASYFTSAGHYSFDANYFAVNGVDNSPLHALANGVDGPNGIYALGSTSTFPTSTFNSSNYWVDVVFNTSNTLPPSVVSSSPLNGETGVSTGATITATFNKAMDATTITASTFQLLDSSNNVVSSTVTYNSSTFTASLQPAATLSPLSTYTVILRGGAVDPRVKDTFGNPLPSNVTWSFTTATGVVGSGSCPCSIWTPTNKPTVADGGDPNQGEFGFRFRSDQNGFIIGIRFYKSPSNAGDHVGHLWTNTGTLLGTANFASETASGWQEALFSSPISITAGTTYVASYFTPFGHYSADAGFFTAAVDNSPLHALADGTDGPSGVFATSSAFPVSTFQSSNYWVDVAFVPSNTTTLPSLEAVSPTINSTGITLNTPVTATFTEPMNASTITASSFTLVNSANAQVSGTVTYDPSSATVTFRPSTQLNPLTTYTATVKGTVQDAFGNAMGSDFSWSFTTLGPPPNGGPGGPILIISSVVNPYSRYLDEILRNEGLNEFTIADIANVNATMLSSFDMVILGDIPLTSSQVSMLSTWVTNGGNLIAMHPDKQLAGLLGLSNTPNKMSDAYLLVNTASSPGVGIVGQTIQYHGSADLYSLNGATSFATLYSDISTATSSPAVTLFNTGAGKAAAFTYDLARSVAYTRQGNPAWSGQERDAQGPIRSNDLFYGAASFDPQPDWVNLTNVAIPQADEQQRLLVNLIEQMNLTKKPLPRFWYLPSGVKAAVIMTGDDHGNPGGTAGRFDQYIADSPAGCSVPDWQCVRSTSYTYTETPLTDAQAASYLSQGFEISIHVVANPTAPLADYPSRAALDAAFTGEISNWAGKYVSQPLPRTHRTHAIAWSDYDSEPIVELAHGIRLDTNYYYFPDGWMHNVPGLFTGSGLPMRFTDRYGNPLDIYQANTQLPDEDAWSFPSAIDTMLDNAVGPLGYYTVVTTNMHTDTVTSTGSDAIVASAKARGVPIVSAQQMLTWLDGRNGSSFGNVSWSGTVLSFTITQATGARNLQAMVPYTSNVGTLIGITTGGNPVNFTVQTIKGLRYAFFNAVAGSYQATYSQTAFSISGTISGSGASGSTVNVTGPLNASANSNSSGIYTVSGLPNGTYTVTPSRLGINFTPSSQTVSVSNANVTGVNFSSAPAPTFTVSGTVSGQGGSGATVSLTGIMNASVKADASGNYTFTGVLNGTYTIAPSNTGFNFLPSSQSVTVNGANIAGVNFSTITTSNSITMDALVSRDGTTTSTTIATPVFSTTSANELLLAFVAADSPGSPNTIVNNVTGAGLTWALVQRTNVQFGTSEIWRAFATVPISNVSVTATLSNSVVSSITVVSFTGTDNSGTNGSGAIGATASGTASSGAPSASLVTTRNNSWVFGVGNDWDHAIARTPAANQTLVHQDLAPNDDTYWVQRQNASTPLSGTTVFINDTAPTADRYNLAIVEILAAITQSPTTTFSVSGTITGPGGSGATVALTGGANASTTADANGNFTFSGVANGTYTVTPSNPGFAFSPTNLSVTVSGANVSGLSFSSVATSTFGVSGNISGPGASGTAVSVTGAATTTTTTDTSGNYSVNLQNGTYTLTPNANGFVFTPTSQGVTVNGANISGVNFVSSATALSGLAVNPTSVTGRTSATGTVTLNGPAPSAGAVVTLSDNSTASQVPASVTVAAGFNTATFTITTSAVATSTTVTITAKYNGVTQTATLTVNPPVLSSLTLSPTAVVGGRSSTGTVTLSGPAPAGGAVVTVSDNSAVAQTPTSVTVAAGSTSARFTITTTAVSTSTVVTVSASFSGVTKTATLTVNPASLSSLTLNPSTVTGGNSSTGTVTLNGPAPSGGATVALTSSNKNVAQVPTSALIPAGATSTTFTVTTNPVHGTSARISGTYLSVTRSALLTVQ